MVNPMDGIDVVVDNVDGSDTIHCAFNLQMSNWNMINYVDPFGKGSNDKIYHKSSCRPTWIAAVCSNQAMTNRNVIMWIQCVI